MRLQPIFILSLFISIIFNLFIFFSFAREINAEPIILNGDVTRVRDGDTLEIGHIAVRLAGISAPETSQRLGPEATQFVKQLILGKPIRCELNGHKSYDRMVGTCYSNNIDLAKIIISAGYAIDCPRYSNGKYAKYEKIKSKKIIKLPRYCKKYILAK